MSEEQAYEKLQDLLSIAEELKASGHYSASNLCDEINLRLGE